MSYEVLRMALSSEYTSQVLKVNEIKETIQFSSSKPGRGNLYFLTIMGLADKALVDNFGMKLLRVPQRLTTSKSDNKGKSAAGGPRKKRTKTDDPQPVEPENKLTAIEEDRALYADHPETVQQIPGTDDNLPPRYYPQLGSTDGFILRSTLPPEFRQIVGSCVPYSEKVYNGIVSIVVPIIAVRGGVVSKADLDNLLKPLGLEDQIKSYSRQKTVYSLESPNREGDAPPPGSKLSNIANFEDALKVMEADQYITKEELNLRDTSGTSRQWINYMLGRRARREFTIESVLGMLTVMMGSSFTPETASLALVQLKKACLPSENGLEVTW